MAVTTMANGNTLLFSGFFPPCRAATTGANITLSGLQTIDGVALAAGDRVLVKDQTDATTNGIYTPATGPWMRTTDAQSNTQFFNGMAVLVAQGNANAGEAFVCTCTDDPVVIGTSLLTFATLPSIQLNQWTASSTTSLTIGTGAATFATQPGKSFSVGEWVLAYSTASPTTAMLGQVTGYTGGALTLSVVATGGSGTVSSWTLVLANSPAAAGIMPPLGTGNVTGAGSSTAGHLAVFADGTGKVLADGGAQVNTALTDPGIVLMKYVAGAWTVVIPGGTVLNTTGSTTDGLQEAINYAIANGYALEVYGRGTRVVSKQSGTLNGNNVVTGLNTASLSTGVFVTGANIPPATTITSIDSGSQIHISNAATAFGSETISFAENNIPIACSTALTVGPAEQWSWKMHDVDITFSAAVTGNGITFDSMMICDVSLGGGQIVYQGSSYAIYFNAQTPVPVDGITVITASRFFFSNVATPTAACLGIIGFNVSGGGFNNNFVSGIELNGAGSVGSPGGADYAIEVFGATASTGFEANVLDFAQLHNVVTAGVQIGTSTLNSQNYRQNVWRIGGIEPSGSGSPDGFNSYGSNDIIHIGGVTSEEGPLARGVVLQTNSGGNHAFVGEVIGNTGAALVDSGSGNFCYGSLRLSNPGGTKGHFTLPDGTIIQYINNASASPSGVTTNFDVPFNTLLMVVASAQSSPTALQVTGTATGVTLAAAVSVAFCSVYAIGR